jgi:hypothetical protein
MFLDGEVPSVARPYSGITVQMTRPYFGTPIAMNHR